MCIRDSRSPGPRQRVNSPQVHKEPGMTQRALTVRNVMLAEPVFVQPACPLRDVLEQMNRLRIGAVVVVNDGRELEGIFTERDLLKRVVDADPGWRDLPVAEWMTTSPRTIGPEVSW